MLRRLLRAFRSSPSLALLALFGLACLIPPSAFAQAGHGNWLLQITYQGSASTTVTNVTGMIYSCKLQDSINVPANQSLSLSTINNAPPSTLTGGITSNLKAYLSYQTPGPGNHTAQLTLTGGQVLFTLTWKPKTNEAPPANIYVWYRRSVLAIANAQALQINPSIVQQGGASPNDSGNSATATGTATLGDISVTATATSPGNLTDSKSNPNPTFVRLQLPVNPTTGVASTSIPLDFPLTISLTHGTASQTAQGDAQAQCVVDFCVEDYDRGAFKLPSLAALAASNPKTHHDPSATRWLPISFAPLITSQPYRTQSGALLTPWGNTACFYSMMLRQEPTTPHYDLEGQMLAYLPGPGADGTYNTPGAPYKVLPGPFIPKYVITDANGERLLFDANFVPYSDVKSTLSVNGNVYTLSNAGPPGSIKQKGYYTYTFEQTGSNPLTARLSAIQENLGNGQINTQSLAWGTSPLLTVTDNTSGQQLKFYSGTGGYLGSVDAPATSGSTPFTHTVTTFDTTGHLTSIKVYDGTGQTLYTTETFSYGNPNGDAIVSSSQSGATASFTYYTDAYRADPFGLSTSRLNTATYGSGGDTSSSDDGASIAGLFTFGYAPVTAGYNTWNDDSRTDQFTDARGNQVKTVTLLSGGINGAINGLVTTAPDFVGAPTNSHVTKTLYSPDVANPATITVYDPLYNLGLFANPWLASLDGNGNLTSTTDPANNIWSFGFDATGQLLTSLTDPTNQTWQFHYGENLNPSHRLTSIVDPGGTTRVNINYNYYGQPTSFTVPSAISASGINEQTSYSYDAVTGDLTSITDPLGDILTINTYDALGDPLSVSIYPDTGNPATSLTPLTTTQLLNAAQFVTQKTLANGVQINNTWNNTLLTQIQTNAPAGAGGAVLARMTVNYDSRGRMYNASDLVGSAAQYRFDKNSNLTKILDGKANTTRLTYGPNNEPTGIIWPDNNSSSLRYNAAGQLLSATDERSILSNYYYNNAYRLSDIQFPAYTAQNVHIDYDQAGRTSQITDATGSRQYNYDPILKRLTSVVTTINALPVGHRTFTVSYSYFGDGTLASMTTPVGTTNFHYDQAGQLSSQTDPFNTTSSWLYDHAGRVTREQTQTASGAILQSNYGWGVSGQTGDPSTAPAYLRTITQNVNGQAFWTYTLTHSYLGQILQSQGTAPSSQSSSETFSYDQRGRIASEAESYQTDAQHTYTGSGSYSHDLANNLNGGVSGWTYNSSNQLTASPGVTGLSYDASGDLTGMNGTTLTYDCWGRLASVGSVSFTYDSGGRRVSKTANGVTTYYLYAGGALIAELDSNSAITRSYTYGITGLISDRTGSQSRFYLFDGQGNTRSILDASGNLLSRGAYTAWGSPLAGFAPTSPFGWKGHLGQYLDSETGLIFLNARYYAPSLGRFVSRDPIAFAGGINVYAYCGGDPINFSDPGGLDVEPVEPTGRMRVLYETQPEFEIPTVVEQEVIGEELTVGGDVALDGLLAEEGVLTAAVGTEAADPATWAAIPITATVGVLAYAHHVNVEAERIEAWAAQPEQLASNPHHVSEIQKNDYKANRPSKPTEAFNRDYHYGRTPTNPQKKSVDEGMLFDHDPPLVQHYYEGDGKGGIPGFQMTQEEREAYARSLSSGKAAVPDQRYSQGAITRGYGVRMRKKYGLPRFRR